MEESCSVCGSYFPNAFYHPNTYFVCEKCSKVVQLLKNIGWQRSGDQQSLANLSQQSPDPFISPSTTQADPQAIKKQLERYKKNLENSSKESIKVVNKLKTQFQKVLTNNRQSFESILQKMCQIQSSVIRAKQAIQKITQDQQQYNLERFNTIMQIIQKKDRERSELLEFISFCQQNDLQVEEQKKTQILQARKIDKYKSQFKDLQNSIMSSHIVEGLMGQINKLSFLTNTRNKKTKKQRKKEKKEKNAFKKLVSKQRQKHPDQPPFQRVQKVLGTLQQKSQKFLPKFKQNYPESQFIGNEARPFTHQDQYLPQQRSFQQVPSYYQMTPEQENITNQEKAFQQNYGSKIKRSYV